MAYPVTYDVDRPQEYDRLKVAFRLILAIPQLLLVGGVGFLGSGYFGFNSNEGGSENLAGTILSTGVLTFVAGILIFLAWFAIMFTGRYPEAFQKFVAMVFRWSQNVQAYVHLQTEPYPPFSGDAPYPLRVSVTPDERHNRLTVFFRIFLVIPHAFVLTFLGIAQSVVTIVAWFAILFTGQYPEGMYGFSVGVSRWQARVTAYLYLLVDEYPPFSLAADAGVGEVRPRLA
jgi:hypothetical protein